MEQFEQLLTCAICLDRYRNPKLLPCQHSFCMEPCMDGLVDYVRRQVKCPECRAEHRIPYQGVQAFPTNVTLQRFLELHIEITGELPDPTSGQTMERCGVCSEKSYCSLCVHCEKKCCPECKDAHMDILRREITRINSQVRRGLHRLQDALALVEKNTLGLQTNCASVGEEVDEIYRRLSKAVKDRTEHLRNEIDRYLGTELRGLIQLKENLELEIANIQSNCDLAEAHINENVPWDDSELLDTKELFLRTVEFIRNFEYEAGDYGRRVRFVMAHDPNQLVLHVAGYGELNIKPESGSGALLGSSSSLAAPGSSPGLMRSKSDHRLASQYRQQEEERLARNRYVPEYEYDAPEYEVSRNKSRYRSRFMRHRDGDDSDGDTRSTVRFTSTPQEPSATRERVLDTEDAARGPLSGIFRLTDSPRVMKKLQECERAGKRKKEEPAQPALPQPPKPQVQVRKQPTAVAKQVSEDDEISRIKKQNKNAAVPPAETAEERQTAAHAPAHPPSREPAPEREPEEPVRRTPVTRRTSTEGHSPSVRSASSDSSTSSESSTGSGTRSTGAPFTAEEMKQKYLSRAPPTTTTTTVTTGPAVTPTPGKPSASTPPASRPFQSRFLGAGNRAAPPPPQQPAREEPAVKKKEEEEDDDEETSSSSEETESETEEESEAETHPAPAAPVTPPTPQERQRSESAMARTDIGPLLARSAEARRGSKEDSPSTRYTTPRGSPAQSVTSPTATQTPTTTATSSSADSLTTPAGYTSRFVANVDHDQTHDEACSYSSNPPDRYRSRNVSVENKSSTPNVEGNKHIADFDLGSADESTALDKNESRETNGSTDSDETVVTISSSFSSSSSVSNGNLETAGNRESREQNDDDNDVDNDEDGDDDENDYENDNEDQGEGEGGDDDDDDDDDEDDDEYEGHKVENGIRIDGLVDDRSENDRDDRKLVDATKEVRERVPKAIEGAFHPENSVEDEQVACRENGTEVLVFNARENKTGDNSSIVDNKSGEDGSNELDNDHTGAGKGKNTESSVEAESSSEEDIGINDEAEGKSVENLNANEASEASDLDERNTGEDVVSANDDASSGEATDAESEDEVTVLTGQLNIRFEDKSLGNGDTGRWSRSPPPREKSVDELFDENGWMITDQDLRANERSKRPSSPLARPPEDEPNCAEIDDASSGEPGLDGVQKSRESPKRVERKRSSSAETSIECTVTDVKQSISRGSECLPRSRVYRQSSLGRDGWMVSDESEGESSRVRSPPKQLDKVDADGRREFRTESSEPSSDARNSSTGQEARSSSTGHDSRSSSAGHDSRYLPTGHDSRSSLADFDARSLSTGHDSRSPSAGHDSRSSSAGHDSRYLLTGHDSRSSLADFDARSHSTGHDSRSPSAGHDSRSLPTGHDSRSLSTGFDSRHLSTGHDSRSLSTGFDSRHLSTGHDSRSSSADFDARSLSTGHDSRSSSAGFDARSLSTGHDSRATPAARKVSLACDGTWALDENGWVIVHNVDNALATNGTDGQSAEITSTMRAQTERVKRTAIDNGALVANATQSKDTERPDQHVDVSRANATVAMQMVTTVFCVSILCYSVLINLFL